MNQKTTNDKKSRKSFPTIGNIKKKKTSKKNPKRKLGMGLSSLLSKDQELASVIKSKLDDKIKNSSLKIEIPKLSSKLQNKSPIMNFKPKDALDQKTIPIQYLVSGKFQPRKKFDTVELEELSESIKSNGVLQPILVRPLNEKSRSYEIIAGERRWRASQIAKLHEVPVIIRNFDDETALGVAMIENLQRSDLNLIEEANGYRTMMNMFQYTQEKLSIHLGKSRSHIANVLRILALPKEIRGYITNGQISFGHARSLITLTEDNARKVCEEIIHKGLSVRQTEKIVQSYKKLETTNNINPQQLKKNNYDANIENLENELTNLLGLKVTISHKSNNSGNLSIYYRNLDEIQPVIDKLKWRPK